MNAKLIAAIGLAAALMGCASPSANDIRMAQERSACGEMGLDPGSEVFGTCVANLDATMFQYTSGAYH